MNNKPLLFKQIALGKKGILLPVAHDALTALLIEKAGFSCFGIGGFGISASSYGYLDLGYIGLKEVVDATQRTTPLVNIPALVDADTGYGGPSEVIKTVKALEKAGAAAIFIEDQVWPKRCGHLNGKEVISTVQMQAKIKAALKAKKNKDLIIMARTDALATNGLKEALNRAKQYHKIGADMIFIEAPENIQQVRIIASELKGIPLMINLIEGGKTPIISQKVLQKMGFNLIAYPLTSLLASAHNTRLALRDLKKDGISKSGNKLMQFERLKQILKKPTR